MINIMLVCPLTKYFLVNNGPSFENLMCMEIFSGQGHQLNFFLILLDTDTISHAQGPYTAPFLQGCSFF